MSRCTGHCCAEVTIDLGAITDPALCLEDGDYIRAMLIPVCPTKGKDDKWRCTCVHFNGQDCTAYEDRPRMCSKYPYGKECTFDGCTRKDD